MSSVIMHAARVHEKGHPLVIEETDTQSIRPREVPLHAKACGMVPKLQNMLENGMNWRRTSHCLRCLQSLVWGSG